MHLFINTAPFCAITDDLFCKKKPHGFDHKRSVDTHRLHGIPV